MKRYAVIPTRNRPEQYARCYAAIEPQVTGTVVTIAHMDPDYVQAPVVEYTDDPPNISTMWRMGLRFCAELAGRDQHLVAILNDDVVVSPTWFDQIEEAMEREGTVLGCGAAHQGMLEGSAFVLKGWTLMPSPVWTWWASDNYLSEQAEKNWGGVTYVPGATIEHERREEPEGALLANARADQARWLNQHGFEANGQRILQPGEREPLVPPLGLRPHRGWSRQQ